MSEITPSPMDDKILVAGIGNIWMKDDGFGGEVAKRLNNRDLPKGLTVTDFGIGGLDLAYELQNGFAALVLVDISRQGGPDRQRSPPPSRKRLQEEIRTRAIRSLILAKASSSWLREGTSK